MSQQDIHPDKNQWNLESLVSELRDVRNIWRQANGRTGTQSTRELPSKAVIENIIKQLSGALFPMRLGPSNLHQEGEDFYVGATIYGALQALLKQVRLELHYHARLKGTPTEHLQYTATDIVNRFAVALPTIWLALATDVLAADYGAPAAVGVDEVLLGYPGILTIMYHRIPHLLYELGVPLVARVISESAHSLTGIDIHPGAQIGS